MSCDQCAPLEAPRQFHSARGLTDGIVLAKGAVASGIIEEIPAGPMASAIPFSALNPTGPWDDLVLYRFRCTACHQTFALSAETYHGSGGGWSPEET